VGDASSAIVFTWLTLCASPHHPAPSLQNRHSTKVRLLSTWLFAAINASEWGAAIVYANRAPSCISSVCFYAVICEVWSEECCRSDKGLSCCAASIISHFIWMSYCFYARRYQLIRALVSNFRLNACPVILWSATMSTQWDFIFSKQAIWLSFMCFRKLFGNAIRACLSGCCNLVTGRFTP